MCAPYVEARPKGGARAEKEIGEKAQKIIRHQIVSTYFLHGAFKVLFLGLKTCLQPSFGLIVCILAPPLKTLKTYLHYMLDRYKKEVGEPSGLQFFSKKWICHSMNDFRTKKSPDFFGGAVRFVCFFPLFGSTNLTSKTRKTVL